MRALLICLGFGFHERSGALEFCRVRHFVEDTCGEAQHFGNDGDTLDFVGVKKPRGGAAFGGEGKFPGQIVLVMKRIKME